MSPTVFWFVVLGICIGLLIWAARRPRHEAVRRWAQARDVPLTDRNAELIHDYLRRTRLMRTIGGVAGGLLSTVPSALYDAWPQSAYRGVLLSLTRSPLGDAVTMIVVGYLVGALVAEYSRPRQAEGRAQRAALVPREWDDYVDVLSRWVLRASVVASFVLVPLAAMVPVVPNRAPLPTPSGSALAALAVLATVAFVEWVQRRIVHRPQPFAAPDLIAADDAMRASSVHAVAGVGLVIALALVGTQMGLIGKAASIGTLRWTLPLLGGAIYLAGIGLWLGYGTNYAWVVRRRLVRV